MVEWWDVAGVQNKCLINQIVWEGTQLPLVRNPRGVKEIGSSLVVSDGVYYFYKWPALFYFLIALVRMLGKDLWGEIDSN